MDGGQQRALIHRETKALALLILVALAAFVLTRSVARANEARRQRDAHAWLSRSEVLLRSGDPAGAAGHLRHAAALDPRNVTVRLALAAALTTANANEEARGVLLDARADAPKNADVHLALGRLEAAHGTVDGAVAAYHDALGELWRPQDAARRAGIRVELARYLLDRGAQSRALSELLILGTEMPDTPAAHADEGHLLLSAGEPPGRWPSSNDRSRRIRASPRCSSPRVRRPLRLETTAGRCGIWRRQTACPLPATLHP